MGENRKRGYSTTSVKAATYLRYAGNMVESRTSKEISEKNPRGRMRFHYDDGDRAWDIMKGYNDDEAFQTQFNCYFEVMDVVCGRKPEAKEATGVVEKGKDSKEKDAKEEGEE